MLLQTQLNSLPLLRPWGLPRSVNEICLIVLGERIGLVKAFARAYPHVSIRFLLVPDMPPAGGKFCLERGGKTTRIPMGGLEALEKCPQWEKLVLCPTEPFLLALCRYAARAGIRAIYLEGYWPPPFGVRPALPDFYARYASELQTVYDCLADDASREVYAARIKTLITGNAGYLPVSAHAEYYHPLVRPEAGEIMLDGGVSDMVGAQKCFAQSVGRHGAVHGFEPIPWMAASARASMEDCPQYHLHAVGLGDRRGQLRFESLRDSSHISHAAGEGSVLCDMTSIDAFTQENHLPRVDCIKLDVEGAELLALHGGKNTIRAHRPKLIVCLYHTPADMVTIPMYIRSLEPRYRMYVAHSSCGFTDTILYAHVPENGGQGRLPGAPALQ